MEAARRDRADLIEKARNGDAGAFRECIKLYGSRVNAIAYQMVGNGEDARDISQEVFIRLYRSLERFNSDYSFTSWLYRLTANLSIDFLRKNARHRQRSLDEPGNTVDIKDRSPGPDDNAESSEFYGAINRLAGELSINQRRVFVLRDLQGFPTEEVAGILKCRSSTVRVHLARARRRIKDALIKHYPDLLEVISDEMPES